jgi:hypothetical protein
MQHEAIHHPTLLRMAGSAALGCAIALCASTHSAVAEPPRSYVRILDGDGRWVAGRLVSLDDGFWTVETRDSPLRPDSARVERIERRSIVAGVVQRWAIDPVPASYFDSLASTPALVEPLSNGVLDFADGQRLPGTFEVNASGAFWNHRWIGAIPVEIDRLASIRFLAATSVVRQPDADTVVLRNGDVLRGFVESLAADLELELDGSETADSTVASTAPESRSKGAVVDANTSGTTDASAPRGTDAQSREAAGAQGERMRKIGIERIASIGFAAIDRTPAPAARIWTMDGSVVGARDLRFDETGGWSFSLTDPLLAKTRPQSTADNLAADPVGFVLESGRMTALAALGTPRLTVPEGASHAGISRACRIAPPEQAALGLASIELAGPVRAEFAVRGIQTDATAPTDLSSGKTTFSAWIELAKPFPIDAVVDVEVSLGDGTRERVRLDAAKSGAHCKLSAPTAGLRMLTIVVTDAGNGPIGDRVLIERATLVVSGGG